MSSSNYHPSVSTTKSNATAHVKRSQVSGRSPFLDYKIPSADDDIANTRNSYRKRDNTVTSSRSLFAGQLINLHIKECMKSLVPSETTIRVTVKLHNFDSTTFMDGSIQRMFRRLIIRDGHGVELEHIEHYNRIYQTLFDCHVPDHIKYSKFQNEGVYDYEVPAMVVGPKMCWSNSTKSSQWESNIHPANIIDLVTISNSQPGFDPAFVASFLNNKVVGVIGQSWIPGNAVVGNWDNNTFSGTNFTILDGQNYIGEYVDFRHAYPVSVKAFTIFGTINTVTNYLPANFRIAASDDGINYTLLSIFTTTSANYSTASDLASYQTAIAPRTTTITQWLNEAGSGPGTNYYQYFTINSNTKKYRYYRLIFNEVVAGNALVLSEIEFEYDGPGSILASIDDFTNSNVIGELASSVTDFSRYASWRSSYNRGHATEPYNSVWSTSTINGANEKSHTTNLDTFGIFSQETSGVGKRGIFLNGTSLPVLNQPTSFNSITYQGHSCFTPWYNHIGSKLYSGGGNIGVGHTSQEITFTFHPTVSGILSSTKHIPLWITKGISIELELDKPINFLRDARSFYSYTKSSFDNLPDNSKPYISITRAEVLWTGVDLTEKMIKSIDRQHEQSGIHMCFPSFFCESNGPKVFMPSTMTRPPNTIYKVEFKNSYAMLNRVYSFGSEKSKWRNDSFNTLNLSLSQRSWEYNRIYRPDWGTDLNVESIDHFYQNHRSLGTLNDYLSNNFTLSDFHNYPSLARKRLKYYVDEFESEPSGFLTGIDTNNEKMVYRVTPGAVSIPSEVAYYFIWHFYKLAVYRKGEPIFVKH